ncbi:MULTISPECIES: hypothetical protein [unclassified Serratia (in: enterobacteria)]|jgi:hypothetical protein|uniref:hypothetical protein n=1 Tax=unclassified Serratia (in: enterobacteria) TaxID=2647522 RepID=UPI002ED6876E|nr:hypothetical protein [Serratia sp. C2(2)]MEE4446282.1 hypothetical protein [Serratia sp. C2(1)]
MNIFESIVDSLKVQLAERQAPEVEHSSISKAKEGLAATIAEHIKKQSAQPVAIEEPATQPADSRKIKSKGIALTAAAQGGPANGRPVSLLMKSSDQPNIIRRQLILKSAAGGATLIRTSDGTLLSENGMQITKSMHALMDQLGIGYTIKDEG